MDAQEIETLVAKAVQNAVAAATKNFQALATKAASDAAMAVMQSIMARQDFVSINSIVAVMIMIYNAEPQSFMQSRRFPIRPAQRYHIVAVFSSWIEQRNRGSMLILLAATFSSHRKRGRSRGLFLRQ